MDYSRTYIAKVGGALRRTSVVLAGLLVALPFYLAPVIHAAPVIEEYPITSGLATPFRIVQGPDGAMWYTQRGAYQIGRISASGSITDYSILPAGADEATLIDITAGPDGNLWFTACIEGSVSTYGAVGKLTMGGVSTLYQHPTGGCRPQFITVGSDGNLWFTLGGLTPIGLGKITPSGVMTARAVQDSSFDTQYVDIISGPDGNLWITNSGRSSILKFDLSTGFFTEYPLPISPVRPQSIVIGPDGNLWFTASGTDKIGKLTTTGTFTFYTVPAPTTDTWGITVGSDGALWFTESGTNEIGRITPDGDVQEYPVPTANASAAEMATGANGDIWFVEINARKIGRITLTPPDSLPPNVSGAVSAQPNSAGWYSSDVTITWSSTDPEPSSGAPTTPPPTLADQEGTYTYTSDPICDPAGNCATGSLELSIDKSAPTVSYNLSQEANGAGWNNGDVTVTFACGDAVSGVESCSEPQTIGEGEDQTLVGTAVDLAGNTSTISAEVSIDKTAPIITSQSFGTNPKSTSQSSVTLTAQVDDNLSGVGYVEYFDPVLGTWQPMILSGSAATAVVNTSFMFFPAGSYTFMVRAWDKADNQSLPTNILLYVYNPGGGYVTGTGFVDPNGPSSVPGDTLPAVQGNNIKASLGFSVRYDTALSAVPTGTSTFSYGQACNSPNNRCFSMTTNSFDWLLVPTSNTAATFQGLANLTLDGQSLGSNYPVRISVEDNSGSSDYYLLRIYAVGANPETAAPLYQASGDPTGNILIHP